MNGKKSNDEEADTRPGRFDEPNGIKIGGCVHHLPDRSSPTVVTAFERSVRISQMQHVVDQLAVGGRDASWAMFMFYTSFTSPTTDDDCINLQYSIEDGRVGLDWILIGPRNIADQAMIQRFVQLLGHRVIERETNNVSYLRIEDGDICYLGKSIVEDVYGTSLATDLGLLVHGFTLAPMYVGTH
jgi:hypothetical protein